MAKHQQKLSPQALYQEARRLQQAHAYEQALELLALLEKRSPHVADVYYQQGRIFFRIGQPHAALAAYAKALQRLPGNPEILNAIGNCHYALGEAAKAEEVYQQVLAAQPDNSHALNNLTQLEQYTAGDARIDNVRSLYEKAGGEDKVRLGFALGKMLESSGDKKAAFAYYHEANQHKQAITGYTPDADLAFMDAIACTFDADFFADRNGWGSDDATPIFIIGMPRCGSTLVEQILASHPKLAAAGELELIQQLALVEIQHKTGQPFPASAAALKAKEVRPLAAGYVRRLRGLCESNAAHIADKMLPNYLYAGLIHLLLPKARIVHVQRDAMDNGWSIYKHYFAASHYYGRNLAHLGAIYNGYRTLMAHWQLVLPGVIHTVEYEQLVQNPEATTRALLEYCGLPWDAACLEFHKTRRAVATASAMQVRQPIYKSALKSWEGLEDELQELRNMLEKH